MLHLGRSQCTKRDGTWLSNCWRRNRGLSNSVVLETRSRFSHKADRFELNPKTGRRERNTMRRHLCDEDGEGVPCVSGFGPGTYPSVNHGCKNDPRARAQVTSNHLSLLRLAARLTGSSNLRNKSRPQLREKCVCNHLIQNRAACFDHRRPGFPEGQTNAHATTRRRGWQLGYGIVRRGFNKYIGTYYLPVLRSRRSFLFQIWGLSRGKRWHKISSQMSSQTRQCSGELNMRFGMAIGQLPMQHWTISYIVF